jgi:hypothetical protein
MLFRGKCARKLEGGMGPQDAITLTMPAEIIVERAMFQQILAAITTRRPLRQPMLNGGATDGGRG